MLRPDEMFYDEREEEFFAKMRGGSKERMGRDNDFEATTVATSVVYPMVEEAGSQIPTVFYSKKINDYSKKLKREQQIRELLEHKVKRLRREVNNKYAMHTNKLSEMDIGNGSETFKKLAVTDQRNCMQTSQNYQMHPQIEDLWQQQPKKWFKLDTRLQINETENW